MIFGELPSEHIAKRDGIRIGWQDDISTESTFTWYASKKELRLTRLGRGFPYLRPDFTGSLFVFNQMNDDMSEFEAYILESDREIESYLTAFGLGPQDAGRMFRSSAGIEPEVAEESAIFDYVSTLGDGINLEFPLSDVISKKARDIQRAVYNHNELLRRDPDFKLVDFVRVEYSIFRAIEARAYGPTISRGFEDVESFVNLANTVLNRRKSRAGKSLEHHLEAIFDANKLTYEPQAKTEGNKKPDFIFPSGREYHDPSYPIERIIVLAAKTTCKDRWRQILNEADRNRGRTHFLVTLQQGNTPAQLKEMQEENVQLIVPKAYIKAYPPEFRGDIWSLKQFLDHARSVLD